MIALSEHVVIPVMDVDMRAANPTVIRHNEDKIDNTSRRGSIRVLWEYIRIELAMLDPSFASTYRPNENITWSRRCSLNLTREQTRLQGILDTRCVL